MKPPHDHVHKRVYAEGSRRLKDEDKHLEYALALKALVKEFQKVDPEFAIVPLDDDAKEPIINSPNDVPLNHTDLGANIQLASNASFQMKRPWGSDGQDVREEDMVDPEVNFGFVFACDKDPEKLFDRVKQEWRRQGGNRLYLKDLQTHDVDCAAVLWKLYTQCHEPTIAAELRVMLEKARDAEDDAAMGEFRWGGLNIPDVSLRLAVPRLPGLDTSRLNKLKYKEKQMRKAMHVDCDRKDLDHLQDLIDVAKERKLVEKMWGKQAAISKPIITDKRDRKKTKAWEIANAKSYSKKHVNLQATMTAVGFSGLWDIDIEVPVYSVTEPTKELGRLTARQVLYSQLKLPDGHSLFADIHQEQAMADVEAVVPRTPDAETMTLMMEKNIAAYLRFYLKDANMPEDFVTRLLDVSCDPSILHEAKHCTWDSKTRVLTTPKDEEEKKNKAIEEAAWYNDVYSELMASPKKGGRKGGDKVYTDPENIYDLDGENSVKTLSQKPGSRYGGSPGAPTFRVGQGKKAAQEKDGDVIDVDAGDDVSVLSTLSREELIRRLREANLESNQKGSAPNSAEDKRSQSESDSGEEGSSDGGDTSSSSGSSEESSTSEEGGGSTGGEVEANGG